MKKFSSLIFSIIFILSSFCFNFSYAASDTSSAYGNKLKIEYADGNYERVVKNSDGKILDKTEKKSDEKRLLKSESVPDEYDSRDYGVVTSVKNQADYGCCWAFAVCSALESDAVKNNYISVDEADFSEAHLVWSTYTASDDDKDPLYGETNASEGDIYNYGGNEDYATLTLVKGCGIADESDFPYDGTDSSNMGNYGMENYYCNNGLVIDEQCEISGNNHVKEWIMDHGAVTAGYYASNHSNYKLFDGKTSYCTDPDSKEVMDHAVTIVGWDDNYPKENFVYEQSGDGAWLVKNSWGSEWGDNGYFWISYYEPSLASFYGFSVKQKDYDYLYTYNGAHFLIIDYRPEDYYEANCYTMKTDEYLDEIGFYTYYSFNEETEELINEPLDVEISVYKLLTSMSNPESGKLIYSGSATVDNPGYHRMSADKGIVLNRGCTYSVVIHLSCEDCVCAPIESKELEKITYNSERYQSYYKDENGWNDTYAENFGNFYINIYTDCAHLSTYTDGYIEETCTEDGFSGVIYCKDCGDLIDTGSVIAAGHKDADAVIENYVASTCTSEGGYDSVIYCSRCSEKLKSDYISLPKKAHKYKYKYNKDATIYSDGTITGVCTECGDTIVKTAPNTKLVTSIEIKNYKSSVHVDYKTTAVFTANVTNPVPGSEIEWYINGKKSGTGSSFTVSQATTSYTVECRTKDASGKAISSETENIVVSSGFFAKVVAFFRSLFGNLPTYIQ